MNNESPDLVLRGLHHYIRLIADQVDSGLSGWYCDLGPPAVAYIALPGRLPLHPEHDVALVWNERDGWAAGIETHSSKDIVVLSYLNQEILAKPEQVANFVDELFKGNFPGQPQPPGTHKFARTKSTEEQLVDYARK